MACILLVEPNIPLAKTYKAILQRAGHEVMVKGDAGSAVYGADECCPDAVILELQLPGHSGVEFLYEFRSYNDWRNIPIVLHTMVPPHNLNLSKQTLDQLDIAAYLYKPSTGLRTLVHTVEAALALQTVK